jgi:hypothetical protein
MGAARHLPVAVVPIVAAVPADVVYGFGRIDASGRAADRAITGVLGWRPGDQLALAADAGVVIARRDPGGAVTMPSRPYLVIPAALRRRCGLRAGDRVLLAVFPAQLSTERARRDTSQRCWPARVPCTRAVGPVALNSRCSVGSLMPGDVVGRLDMDQFCRVQLGHPRIFRRVLITVKYRASHPDQPTREEINVIRLAWEDATN